MANKVSVNVKTVLEARNVTNIWVDGLLGPLGPPVSHFVATSASDAEFVCAPVNERRTALGL